MRPENYREWIDLSSGLGMTYGVVDPAQNAARQRFDNVFVTPQAYKAFLQTGTWPDKTMFILEVRSSTTKGSINKGGHYQEGVVALEAHVKDEARFPNKWAFFDLGTSAPAAKPLAANSRCQTCHAEHGAVDQTFVQFYPTLSPSRRPRVPSSRQAKSSKQVRPSCAVRPGGVNPAGSSSASPRHSRMIQAPPFCRADAYRVDPTGNPAHAFSMPNHSRMTACPSPLLRHQCAASNGSAVAYRTRASGRLPTSLRQRTLTRRVWLFEVTKMTRSPPSACSRRATARTSSAVIGFRSGRVRIAAGGTPSRSSTRWLYTSSAVRSMPSSSNAISSSLDAPRVSHTSGAQPCL